MDVPLAALLHSSLPGHHKKPIHMDSSSLVQEHPRADKKLSISSHFPLQNTSQCSFPPSRGTVYASHCLLDPVTHRTVAAQLNFCPSWLPVREFSAEFDEQVKCLSNTFFTFFQCKRIALLQALSSCAGGQSSPCHDTCPWFQSTIVSLLH